MTTADRNEIIEIARAIGVAIVKGILMPTHGILFVDEAADELKGKLPDHD